MNPQSYATAQKIFAMELAVNLFANNAFILQSINWSKYAKGNQVNFPQSGAKPRVIRNRDATALSAVRRADVNRSYNIDEFQTEPTTMPWSEEILTNYALRQDILRSHTSGANDDIAQTMLFRWLDGVVAGNIVRTSGGNRTATATGATGTRKKITLDDIIDAVTVLNNQDVPDDGRRCMIVNSQQYADLLRIEAFWDSAKNIGGSTLVSGSIARAMGLNIFVRSKTLAANNTSTPVIQLYKADNSFDLRASAVTDNSVIAIWHPDMVTRSVSPDSLVNIIPDHGATEFSVTPLAGGKNMYSDFAGVAVIVEAVGV